MSDYPLQKKKYYTLKLRAVLSELPRFAGLYFRAMELQTSILTRYGYAIDLRNFFKFLTDQVDTFQSKSPASLTLEDLDRVTALDIELFLEHMSLYTGVDERERENNERAKARKLSAIRSFFKYYHRQELIKNNPASLVDTPKIHEKAIIRLEANEVADLLDIAEAGNGLTERQTAYHEATKVRDTAILTLFLGTGIRISELVGIDIDDVDFASDAFIVTRKGGNQEMLSFGPEVRNALLAYLEQRELVAALPGSESALFLSMQRKRITARAVENLVKKYSESVINLKHISPHKLRSSYGTALYRESGDIYLVADVLGHKDVNTTRRHYAQMEDDRRRKAASFIRLREEDPASEPGPDSPNKDQKNSESN